MQVAIVYIGQNKELSEYSKYFSIKLSEKNHIPTFINGILEKPRMAFFGAHFLREEDMEFKGATVNLQYMREWTGKSGFVTNTPPSLEEASIKYVTLKDVIASYNENTIKIGLRYNKNLNWDEESIRQTAFVDFSFATDLDIWGLISHIKRFRDLISLGIKRRTTPLSIEVELKNPASIESKSNGIELIFPPLNAQTGKDKLTPADMMFWLHDLEANLGSYLTNWYGDESKLQPAMISISAPYIILIYTITTNF